MFHDFRMAAIAVTAIGSLAIAEPSAAGSGYGRPSPFHDAAVPGHFAYWYGHGTPGPGYWAGYSPAIGFPTISPYEYYPAYGNGFLAGYGSRVRYPAYDYSSPHGAGDDSWPGHAVHGRGFGLGLSP